MKKNLMILILALLIALPVIGLAADTTASAATRVQSTNEAPAAAFGRQNGRRWNQVSPKTRVPVPGFVDADGDGLCDNCGNAQGKNPDAPNYVDENKDGVCDHFGTDEQGQGRMQGAQGRGRGTKGRGQQAQGKGMRGNAQGRNYLDANNDGVCDNFGSNVRKPFGRGRNRR